MVSAEQFRKMMESENYRGLHTAPNRESGSPLYDLTLNGTYPEDIYSASFDKACRYYCSDRHDSDIDKIAMFIVRSSKYHNKPNAKIKIYRAVPKVLTIQERIDKLESDKKYILKYKKLPKSIDNYRDSSEYYDYATDKIAELKRLSPEKDIVKQINSNDWVAITRQYAVQHGKSILNNKYDIITKTILARDVFCDGDSISEWGYVPQ